MGPDAISQRDGDHAVGEAPSLPEHLWLGGSRPASCTESRSVLAHRGPDEPGPPACVATMARLLMSGR